jgi:hypothetical protein
MRRFIGATYDRHRNRWASRIVFNGKQYRKYFHSEQEAFDWYDAKSIELYGFDRQTPTPNVKD